MTDPNVKMVNVQVETGSTEHALLTGAKKTRRRRNANLGSTSSPTPSPDISTVIPPSDNTKNAIKVMKAGDTASVPALSPPAPAPAPPPASSLGPPQPLKITASPVVPDSAVKIAPKNGQASPTPVPRLLPKKRIGTAPAAETLKQKPKFVVDSAIKPENSLKGGTSAPEVPTSGTNRSTVVAVDGVRSRTRRSFKERRISLTVQPTKKSRKYRRTLRARVAEMPLQQVRRLLLRKGVLKPKTGADTENAPPEKMMRSMLVDYMLLHHAD